MERQEQGDKSTKEVILKLFRNQDFLKTFSKKELQELRDSIHNILVFREKFPHLYGDINGEEE